MSVVMSDSELHSSPRRAQGSWGSDSGLVKAMTSWMVQSLHVYKGSQQNQENHYI